MGLAAAYIARLLERHHWIAYVGLAVIFYVAIEMIVGGAQDVALVERLPGPRNRNPVPLAPPTSIASAAVSDCFLCEVTSAFTWLPRSRDRRSL
jgi:predicted tellurium resistance membrane protein TerC